MRDVGSGWRAAGWPFFCVCSQSQGGWVPGGEYFLRSGKAVSIWLALQPVPSQPGSDPVNGHGPHRPGLCCDQQEMLAPGEAAGSGRVCVCARVHTCEWTDQASNVSTPQTLAKGLRHRNVDLACRRSPRENHCNGGPVLGLILISNRSSCAAPLFLANEETKAQGSEIACPRSHWKHGFKAWLHH